MAESPSVESTNEFSLQCAELGEKINCTLFGYPKGVAICVLPAVMAGICATLDVPRDTVIAMFDSALEDIRNGGPST